MNLEEALLIQREAKRVSKSVSEVETVDLGEVAKVVHAQDEDDGGQGSRAVPTSLPQTLSQVGHHGRENAPDCVTLPHPSHQLNPTIPEKAATQSQPTQDTTLMLLNYSTDSKCCRWMEEHQPTWSPASG